MVEIETDTTIILVLSQPYLYTFLMLTSGSLRLEGSHSQLKHELFNGSCWNKKGATSRHMNIVTKFHRQ